MPTVPPLLAIRSQWLASSTARRTVLAAALSCWGLLAVGVAFSQDALSPLDLVDGHVGVCLEARGLEAKWKEVRGSAWAARFERSRLYDSWKKSEPGRRIGESREAVEKLAGKPLKAFLGEIFGRHMVVALYPRGGGESWGILITEAASEAAIDDALAVWSRAEPRESETRRHLGVEYVRRGPPGKDSTSRKDSAPGKEGPPDSVYTVRFGRLLALSDREPLIQQAIELAQKQAASNAPRGNPEVAPLAASGEFAAARQTISESCFLRLFIQPQELLKDKVAEADPPAPDWVRGWQRCRSVTVGLRFDEGWIAEATARFPEDASSERWTKFVTASRGNSSLLDRVPAEALAVWSGQLDLSETGRLLQELAQAKDKRGFARFRNVLRGLLLGYDPVGDVLPALGPGTVGYLVPRRPAADVPVPWDAVLAWSVRPVAGEDQQSVPLHAGLDNALMTGLNLLAAMRNSSSEEGAVVRSEALGKDSAPADGEREKAGPKLRWVEGLGPVSPAFVALPDLLAFGTSPDTLRQFLNRPGRRLADAEWHRTAAARHFRGGNQVLAVNVAGVRHSLEDHRTALVAHAVKREAIETAEAERRFDDVLDVLRLLDTAFATAEFQAHEVRLTLGGVVK